MDILQKKTYSQYNNELLDIMKIFKFDNKDVILIGSSSLQSQQYFSDFDFILNILNKNSNLIYDNINKILDKIKSKENLYFIELKIQTTDNNKIRYFKNDIDKFKLNDIKDNIDKLDFIKIDIIAYFNYKFFDISVNYEFYNDGKAYDEITELEENIFELKEDKQYYKMLKRVFSYYKALIQSSDDEDLIYQYKKKLILLTRFFNSDIGKIYQIASNLQTIISLLENYDDITTKERVVINLKTLNLYDKLKNMKISDIEEYIKKLKKIINQTSKSFIQYNDIRI